MLPHRSTRPIASFGQLEQPKNDPLLRNAPTSYDEHGSAIDRCHSQTMAQRKQSTHSKRASCAFLRMDRRGAARAPSIRTSDAKAELPRTRPDVTCVRAPLSRKHFGLASNESDRTTRSGRVDRAPRGRSHRGARRHWCTGRLRPEGPRAFSSAFLAASKLLALLFSVRRPCCWRKVVLDHAFVVKACLVRLCEY